MALHTDTISRLLHQTLLELMRAAQLQTFVLADSIAISLQYGHRKTKEIDLYSPSPFREYDFQRLKTYLESTFGRGEQHQFEPKGNGTSLFISNLNQDYGKIDLYYDAVLTEPAVTDGNFRFAGNNDLMALRLHQLLLTGSKSEFWDVHFLVGKFGLDTVLNAYRERYPETFKRSEMRRRIADFRLANEEPDPVCLLKKRWEMIRLDFMDWAAHV